ncbi:MAG: DUF349 domain-containing protein [Tannerella sp.]|nr:DUF349 domain-containing protein [Tannerella sp.]
MDTRETNLLTDEAGEKKPFTHLQEAQPSEIIRPEETETVEETSIQQEVINQSDAVPEIRDAIPEEPDASVSGADDIAAPEEDDVVAEEEVLLPEDENVAQEEPDAALDAPEMKELPTTPDNYCGELQEAIEVGAIGMLSKQKILDELQELIAHVSQTTREQVDGLKQAYYRITQSEIDELKQVFVENGGAETDFEAPEDETAPLLKALLAEYKEKKSLLHEKEALTKEENHTKKLQLIDRLQVLVESQDDFNKRYNEFKEIQQKWKEYDPVPQGQARELWRNFQIQSERFYDLVKINNQFRDYDFKKNLELKTILCVAAEKLAGEPDAISAYHQLQKLFQQWRETGPVARDVRETLWMRFKEASGLVNRKHQAHLETIKAKEEKSLNEKTAICEQVESIDYDTLKTSKDWDKKSEEVIGLQKKWRTVGFATKKHNNKIFDRFRTACDRYFEKKDVFYKSLRVDLEKNLQQKRELIAKAESFKDRTDWKDATKAMIDIQNEWKKIGPVARKNSALLWKQFVAACDYFFEQKSRLYHSQKTAESTNLATKRLLIEKIQSLASKPPTSETLTTLKLLIAEWNTVGHVPFKEKDPLHKAFRDAVDQQYDRLNIAQSDRRMQQFRSTLTDNGNDNGKKLHGERDKLMRAYERMKSELQTYENNVGFFNVSSKGGNNLRKEMEHKIERLKDEMALIVKKIDAIDENLN